MALISDFEQKKLADELRRHIAGANLIAMQLFELNVKPQYTITLSAEKEGMQTLRVEMLAPI